MKRFKQKWILPLLGVAVGLAATAGVALMASDHDDGELDLKGRALNITDMYIFREDWHTTNAADNGNLIAIMNVNPRALPGFSYYFSTQARYEMHFSRVAAKADTPTGADDVTLRFEFGAADATTGVQAMTMTTIVDGVATASTTTAGGTAINTTGYVNSKTNTSGSRTENSVTVGGGTFSVFAGLREDPFFFDVERYFQVRAYLAGIDTALTPATIQSGANVFRSDATAIDFTKGYNVSTIVVRVPKTFLQKNSETVFDFWGTISVPN